MPLQKPIKDASGYFICLNPPVISPPLSCEASIWMPTMAWCNWAEAQRASLIDELLANPNWFSKPPRRELLETMCSPWFGITLEGSRQIFSLPPPMTGSAIWELTGLTMTAKLIAPRWKVTAIEHETIPFFETEDDEREISLEEIESAPPAVPTMIRNRDWETKKFMSKERVRESRLKAQLALRMAEAEEARHYKRYGDFEDDESHFSEYDLTDHSESE